MASAIAPASSANLGPGFDTLALALDVTCEVIAEPAETWSIDHVGPEVFAGSESDDAVLRAAKRMTDQPLRLEVRNDIPVSSGMGSSAAAFTAGALAALRATGNDPDHNELFESVCDLEGHPDNAAAAIYGGLVAVTGGGVVELTLSPELVPIVVVPGIRLSTVDARQVLPEVYDKSVVTRSLGRISALLEGLRTGSDALLDLAGGDELHEAPRAGLSATVPALIAAAREAGALYACWSGAGPSVLALVRPGDPNRVAESLQDSVGSGGRVFSVSVDTLGTR